MARRHLESHLSRKELDLAEVWSWYTFQRALVDEEEARTLDALLTGAGPVRPPYFGKSRDELIEFFDQQREVSPTSAVVGI